MIEAREDITIVVDKQIHDIQVGQRQYKSIAEGREIHPLELEREEPLPTDAITVAAIVEPRHSAPPPDPDKAMRHLRLSAVIILALVLFLLWLRQRRK